MKRNLNLLAVINIFIFYCINSLAAQQPETNIPVNPKVSTHITVGEPIKYVDISTNLIVGDIPVDNILRIKPVLPDSGKFTSGEMLAIVTIVTERNKFQFKATYASNANLASADINLSSWDMASYMNPNVSMPRSEMYMFAWKVWNSNKKFYDVSKEAYKLRIHLLNIYTVGDYFFIDLALENKTKIKYDIEQIRFKIEDKRLAKATNFQSIEIQPEMSLHTNKYFWRDYRNVFVFKKFTFPDEKVFKIEISEPQISGRTVTLKIDYQDILNADNFNKTAY